jgi:hypothetical protein
MGRREHLPNLEYGWERIPRGMDEENICLPGSMDGRKHLPPGSGWKITSTYLEGWMEENSYLPCSMYGKNIYLLGSMESMDGK